MSLYHNTFLVDRSYSLTACNQREHGPSHSLTVSAPPTHDQNSQWSHFYIDHNIQPSSSSFDSYIATQSPEPSSSSSASSWQSNGISSERPISQIQHAIDVYSNGVNYQSPTMQSHSYSSSQYTPSSSTSPPHSRTCFPNGYRDIENASPASHTSSSDYGTGTKGWDSPLSSSREDTRHTPSQFDAADVDGSVAEMVDREGSLSILTHIPATDAYVKVEPEEQDNCFILENSAFSSNSGKRTSVAANRAAHLASLVSQSLAPPTEVPLRATQANKDMRQMMGVFRLNPFAMHSLSTSIDEDGTEGDDGQASWCGEAGPLEEEPVTFEFQLNIDGLDISDEVVSPSRTAVEMISPVSDTSTTLGLKDDEAAQLRSFSPSFQLHSEDVEPSYSLDQKRPQSIQSDEGGQQREHEDRNVEPWGDVDCSVEIEISSTRSIHTPVNDNERPNSNQTHVYRAYNHSDDHPPCLPPSTSMWAAAAEQYHEDIHYPSSAPAGQSRFNLGYNYFGVKPRLHTTTSHPYTRRSSTPYQSAHLSPPSTAISYLRPQLTTKPTPTHLHHPQEPQTHILDSNSAMSYPRPHIHQEHGLPVLINAVESRPMVSNYQEVVEQPSGAYMRIGKSVRQEAYDYEQPSRGYSPSSISTASNDASIAAYANEAVFPGTLNVHDDHQASLGNLTAVRRWSLPEMNRFS